MNKAQCAKLKLIAKRAEICDPMPKLAITHLGLVLESMGLIKEVSLPGRFGHYMPTVDGLAALAAWAPYYGDSPTSRP